MTAYSAFPKVQAPQETYHQIVKCHIEDTRWRGVLPLSRDAVGVFYSPSRLGKVIFECLFFFTLPTFKPKVCLYPTSFLRFVFPLLYIYISIYIYMCVCVCVCVCVYFNLYI